MTRNEKRRKARDKREFQQNQKLLRKRADPPPEDDLQDGDEVIDLNEQETPEVEAPEAEISEEERVALELADQPLGAEDASEPVSKDMGYADPMMTNMGPTSWDELDANQAAEEQAQAVRQISYATEDLVRNVMYHPMMEPAAKAKAIKGIADGVEERMKGAMANTEKARADDMDLLELQALIAIEERNNSVLSSVADFVKETLSTATRNNLSDGDFALVITRGGKKVRKYPIHDASHVRNALARAAQAIKMGGQAASDAHAAMPKIRAAAKKMGIGMNAEKSLNAIAVEKDLKGNWRWVGWVSNNFQDLDGDIIAEDAHKEWIEWLDKNKDVAPVFVSWHTPGTAREAPVDFWMYEKGSLIYSGILTEKEAAGLLRAQQKYHLGMSHGTFVLARDPNDPRVITKYRNYEASDLPVEKAANPWTDFATIIKEVGMSIKKDEYLATLIGPERAKEFLARTGLKQAALEAAGVESKEKKDDSPAPAVPANTTVVVNTPAAPVAKGLLTPEQIAQVEKELKISDLGAVITTLMDAADKVPVLEALVKELANGQEEKLAALIQPAATKRFPWENRASQRETNLIKADNADDKKLHDSGPAIPEGQEYWLSQATGTAPIEVQQEA